MIDFDVETQNLQWYEDAAGLFMVSACDDLGSDALLHPRQQETIQLMLSRKGPNYGYEGWNTKFDLHVLRAAGYDLPPDEAWNDGMVRAHICDERSSVALKNRAEKLFGEEAKEAAKGVQVWLKAEAARRREDSKATGEEFYAPDFSDVPYPIMEPYAKGDVELTRRVRQVYTPQIAEHFKPLYDLEMDVMRSLFWMEDRGIPMDRNALARLDAQLLSALDEREQTCVEIAGYDNFNPRSPKQIGEAIDRSITENNLSINPPRKGGNIITDEEHMQALDHPLAAAILSYRGEHKLYAMVRGILHTGSGDDGKFPAPYLTGEDRLHPNFRQLGARTGRMSCSNPNFQQINRDDLRLRYAVAAGPGKKIVTCDLDSIELRLLAAFAGEGAFRRALLEGGDPHEQTAKFVGLTGRRRSTGAVESPRDQGKRLNYLIVYGGGVRAIMKWFGVPQKEARAIMQRMHRAYPEVGVLQNKIDFTLEERGYVKSPLTGRRFRMYGSGSTAVDKEGYKFINYLIQGTAADILKIAAAEAHKRGLPLIAAVHDELMLEVDEADAEEAAHELEDCMTSLFPQISEKVPITAGAQIVDRWSDAKTKPGKPHFVPDYLED